MRITVVMEKENFPDDFKKYMDTELNWLPVKWLETTIGGVFWRREDDEPKRPPADTLDLKKKIRDVLYWILQQWVDASILVQFWAPITTTEGRSFLATQNQPFALSSGFVIQLLDSVPTDLLDIKRLCSYRMISKDYKFNVDLDGGESCEEEDLGLLGRVFKYQWPESSPNVEYYSIKEYSQRNDAIGCGVRQCLAFPVFERSTQRCVGVLEVVTQMGQGHCTYSCLIWSNYFSNQIYENFEEEGLQGSLPFKHEDMVLDVDKNEVGTIGLDGIKGVLSMVCEVHDLPLAQAWVLCRVGWPCKALVDGDTLGVSCYYYKHVDYSGFQTINNVHHLKKGVGVVGRALLSTKVVFCRDVTRLSLTEYPLAHYAQEFGLSGCFAICLRSHPAGNDVYVLEFFMPVSNTSSENPHNSLRKILETMKKYFQTFRVPCREEIGKDLCIEEIGLQNGGKLHSGKLDDVQMLQTTISLPWSELLMQVETSDQQLMDAINDGSNVASTITCTQEKGIVNTSKREGNKIGVKIKISIEDILQTSKMSLENAAKKLEVSKSTLKRVCREYGIERWPPRKINKAGHSQLDESASCVNSDHPTSTQASGSATIVPAKPRDTMIQDANIVAIKAKYEDITMKFRLSLSSSFVDLQQEVAKRQNLKAGTYNVKYKDEDGELILMACDDDLQDCMQVSRSPGNTSIIVLLEKKLPITHHQKKKKKKVANYH